MEIPYSKILETSVLGALLLISLVATYNLFKLLVAEKDKRREDAEKLNNGLMKPIAEIQEQGKTQISLLRQFLEKTQ